MLQRGSKRGAMLEQGKAIKKKMQLCIKKHLLPRSHAHHPDDTQQVLPKFSKSPEEFILARVNTYVLLENRNMTLKYEELI